MPVAVIVSGPPGTGKTALATKLAKLLTLPLYSRDTIKESLFGTLGWSDRQRSKQLGAASATVLFNLLEAALKAGSDCLAESNFRPTHATADFLHLIDRTGCAVVQVRCVADGPVLLERFTARSSSAERHPGHCDDQNADEFRDELLAGSYEPLDLPGPVLTVDTTDFQTIDIPALAAQITALHSCPGTA
ncbi:AAA family ATPase [Streptomyces inusitatus]|nr:AAA family ATPase [Streptomyces inusitatus]